MARERAWVPLVPAAVSWALLFGYQWAFYLAYRGHQPTVFSYFSGVLGDGLLIPALNVSAFVMLRQLPAYIPWRRMPIYVLLGYATAMAAFLTQARLDWVNWSMPSPYQWSEVGQFHFFVMWAEMSYLYLVFATAINNWRALRSDAYALRSFAFGWMAVMLFGVTLALDYIH